MFFVWTRCSFLGINCRKKFQRDRPHSHNGVISLNQGWIQICDHSTEPFAAVRQVLLMVCDKQCRRGAVDVANA